MKILVVSDVESKFLYDYFDRDRFRDVEMIISCGDLPANYLSFLVTMLPCPLFYVPGNHDKKYVEHPPEGCVCIDGRIVDYKGIRLMGLGGCRSSRQVTYEYSDAQMWKRLKRMEPQIRRAGGIDIFVSHAPALGLGDANDQFHQGFEAFRYFDDVYKPDIHFYGHFHASENPNDRRAMYAYHDTVMINGTGYKVVDYIPGRPIELPLGKVPFLEIPTPQPPRKQFLFIRK